MHFIENDQTGLKWKWTLVKQSGVHVSPRCSASATLIQPGTAYMFGGVYDEEENDEELNGNFYNDLFCLNLSKSQWHTGIFFKSFKIDKRKKSLQM